MYSPAPLHGRYPLTLFCIYYFIFMNYLGSEKVAYYVALYLIEIVVVVCIASMAIVNVQHVADERLLP